MVTSVRGSGKWMTCLSYLDRRAFTKGTVWEIGRTQVGENAVAVWKTRVQGQARSIRADAADVQVVSRDEGDGRRRRRE